MKLKWYTLILSLIFALAAYSLEVALPVGVQQAEKAVYRLHHKALEEENGTGFFISPHLFAINFHTLGPLDAESEHWNNISFSQNGRSVPIQIKKLKSVSLLADLALLEVDCSGCSILPIHSSLLDPELFIVGYPFVLNGVQFLRKTGEVQPYSDYDYEFAGTIPSVSYVGGASGSPILNPQGEVQGILSKQSGNVYMAVYSDYLDMLLHGEIGSSCSDFDQAVHCIQHEIDAALKKADQGDVFVQMNRMDIVLSHYEYRSIHNKFHHQQTNLELSLQINELREKMSYWTDQAAEQGHRKAQLIRAFDQYSTYPKDQRNDAMAFSTFRSLAEEENNVFAQYYTGLMIFKGRGTARNIQQALYWLRKSAHQHYMKAQLKLAEILYAEGLYKEAYNWYQKSADEGSCTAQYWSGTMLLNGQGVANNEGQATRYLISAAECGIEDAATQLSSLKSF